MNLLCQSSGRLLAKHAIPRRSIRNYSTEVTESVKKETKGGFSSGLTGFLVGVSITGAIGYYYLLEEYTAASNSLLKSVEQLETTTKKVRDYAHKIESVEKDVNRLKETVATVQQLSELKSEIRRVYDTLNIDHLELKTHVWGLEQDLKKSK
ncbi:hypothetical protein J3Q64DRAFT_1727073 [Phycomyces blakesleeanus]|uniref:Uncharacterized protein n=2 Tax=Phycomyces blakesleeanus TaxID=4837 RepID=A0A162V9S6_PHYB8|nr:hypothetical protein PHYBLDRAFT_129589 [Phycomyces blakesleeanus NRRL 1555(-)]OAD81072.1 hypothetical protein PHYBLDRAFT_129589 [Phycomyces blakesleeanus NRRL 1555(-)]|eukprot:XP_018299112.1 hypothetical protein PHYBLDRAFT_129589 [Phycomyces blakesleeanus NRRL 1555(-)]